MEFEKLSKIKKEIIRRAYQQGYIGGLTYPREKEALRSKGWLQGYCPDQYHIISGQWMLTPAGRKAYEETKS